MVDDPETYVQSQIYSIGRIPNDISSGSAPPDERIAGRPHAAWWRRTAPQDATFDAARDHLLISPAKAASYHSPPHYDDPATACNAAITALWRMDHNAPDDIDLAVSRVAYFALCGDRACAWLVATVLQRSMRAKRTDEEMNELHRLIDAWRRFATRQDQPCHKV